VAAPRNGSSSGPLPLIVVVDAFVSVLHISRVSERYQMVQSPVFLGISVHSRAFESITSLTEGKHGEDEYPPGNIIDDQVRLIIREPAP
jgi:hypothetical protein